jgi:hypothetical protein
MQINARTYAALGLLSATILIFEINLTRLFSVAQFYHFAFLIVSLALLGFGASGTALALFPHWGRRHPSRSLRWLALACALTILGAYGLTNALPFDSFSIAWDRRQVLLLALHSLMLASPFFCSGLAVGLLLSVTPRAAGQVYAVNLVGAALGCLIALVAPAWLGGEGTVVLSCWLGAVASVVAQPDDDPPRQARVAGLSFGLPAGALLLFGMLDLGLRTITGTSFRVLDLRLSPYKGLSYALQFPGADVTYRRWNAFSRVDVVHSPGVRSLPGLSYRYLQPPPPEHGLLVDGDDLSPVVLPGGDLAFAGHLPAAIAFQLRPQAEALILEPRGGLDVVTALALGARQVTAVEMNPLIVEAAGPIYTDPRVHVIVESDRSYIRRSPENFDVVILSLASTYHPVRSGAYSLAEDYRYTVEAFAGLLARLRPGGLLMITRWLQMPPSEELRAFALAVTAVEQAGGDPAAQIVAFRGYNTGTLLVKPGPFTQDELKAIRAFAASRAFDLVYAPDLRPDEVNRYNILPEPVYSQAFAALITADSRERWYASHDFDVSPPTDDRPFFGHFFKWAQARQVMAELGMTWQPFGGAGYFVVLALLGLALVMGVGLIVLPLAAAQWRARRISSPSHPGLAHPPSRPRRAALAGLAYFGLIGLAFLLVEIPLIQRFILFLGHPAYALTAVLFALLLFSGLGSQIVHTRRIPQRPALALLTVLVLGLPWLLSGLFALSLGLPLWLRVGLTMAALAPVGVLMGMPFPLGLRWLEKEAPDLIPWVWGVNGAASVVSAVLAALLALSFGFSWVLMTGAACYASAWLTAAGMSVESPAHPAR